MAANAPGRLDEIRAFLNTVDFDEPVDPLAGPDKLERWLGEAHPGRYIEEEGLARLRHFREALRAVVEAHAGHGDLPQAAERLQPFLEAGSFKMEMPPGGPPRLRGAGDGAQGVISDLLSVMYDAAGAGTWQRLKACRQSSCRFAFYDASKNGSGTWCDMAVCGNRVKAQRRRAREKTPKNIA